MEQSQTPGDLVHHPDYDSKKALIDLKKKLTDEGVDSSMILAKLKGARDAIEHACNVCMVTDEDELREFWNDRTFSERYGYYLSLVRATMLRKRSNESEISDAVNKAKRAIIAAREACTTDVERAELLRVKNLKYVSYEDAIYAKIDADPDYLSKDKVAALEEYLRSVGAKETEISRSLKEAEAATQHAISVCKFNDKEKHIYRCDVDGIYSSDLLFLLLLRLEKLGYNEVDVDEMFTRAGRAVMDAENVFRICETRHRLAEDEEDGGGTSKRLRID